ncbi:MAG: hypothetical protein LR011_06340 [Verrucomicrobia bacterium]|nr:hypothetical protein [Verrucomicrobiota bacterium]
MNKLIWFIFMVVSGMALGFSGEEYSFGHRDPGAPVENPEIVVISEPMVPLIPQSPPVRQAASQNYDFGPISPDEQMYLELINRARRDPIAEAKRLESTEDSQILFALQFFGTDLGLLRNDPEHGFQTFSVAQPLAPNRQLQAAAKVHTDDLFENTYQGHVNDAGKNAGDRINAEGYRFRTWGENVYSTSFNNYYGHAGFQIDWGIGPGGIQSPPGHRITIHNGAFREVGIAVFNGSKPSINPGDSKRQDVGPQLVTQVFADTLVSSPFITGVAYYDLNNNQFYDENEGISGLRVESTEGSWYTSSAQSGGYAIPSNGNGAYTMIFSDGVTVKNAGVSTVSNNLNSKLDLVLPYQPVDISHVDKISTLHAVPVSFSPIFGATDYQWQLVTKQAGPFLQNADSGPLPFTPQVTPGYSLLSRSVRFSGSQSFHLFHNTNPPQNQFLIWEDSFLATENAQLSFRSQHMAGTVTQVATIDIQIAGKEEWDNVWTNPGRGQVGDTSFQLVQVPLSQFNGSKILIRFGYTFSTGGFIFFDQLQDPSGIGWYFDDVELSGVFKTDLIKSGMTGGPATFSLQSDSVGTQGLIINPIISGSAFPANAIQDVESVNEVIDINPGTASVDLRSFSLAGNQWNARVGVTGVQSPVIQVLASPQVAGPYTTQPGVIVSAADNAGEYIVSFPYDGSIDSSFFLIRAE